jgi:hypothetical protein
MKVTFRIGHWPVTFPGVLTIVFVTLRLLDKIDWSWWWVLSPMWISAALSLAVFGVIALIIVHGR